MTNFHASHTGHECTNRVLFGTGRSHALLRNHENPAGISMLGPWTGDVAPEAWSRDGMGGVTRAVLDPETDELRSSNLVLGGSILNCAGGPSPWGWLTAEESFAQRHGFVFACDPLADRIAAPRPIRGYGKLRHEAVAVECDDAVADALAGGDGAVLPRRLVGAEHRRELLVHAARACPQQAVAGDVGLDVRLEAQAHEAEILVLDAQRRRRQRLGTRHR